MPVGEKSLINNKLSLINNKLSPINHQSPVINDKLSIINFPAICLVVSGGHTQLILMKKIRKYRILGETRDDAAGECFDKTARILGLDYPGGPAIAKQARTSLRINKRKLSINLPRPMLYTKDYDFSFSGLKTAALYDYKKRRRATRSSKRYIQAMSAEIQQAIIDVLIKKTIKAGRDFKARTIILGGGVVANRELRIGFQNEVKARSDFALKIPELEFCNDNGAMIAAAAWFNRKKAVKSVKAIQKIKPNPNLRI